MSLLKLGRIRINLEYVISTEDDAEEPEPPGGISVWVIPGREYRFTGDKASTLRRFLDERDIAGGFVADDSDTIRVGVDRRPELRTHGGEAAG